MYNGSLNYWCLWCCCIGNKRSQCKQFISEWDSKLIIQMKLNIKAQDSCKWHCQIVLHVLISFSVDYLLIWIYYYLLKIYQRGYRWTTNKLFNEWQVFYRLVCRNDEIKYPWKMEVFLNAKIGTHINRVCQILCFRPRKEHMSVT